LSGDSGIVSIFAFSKNKNLRKKNEEIIPKTIADLLFYFLQERR